MNETEKKPDQPSSSTVRKIVGGCFVLAMVFDLVSMILASWEFKAVVQGAISMSLPLLVLSIIVEDSKKAAFVIRLLSGLLAAGALAAVWTLGQNMPIELKGLQTLLAVSLLAANIFLPAVIRKNLSLINK